jgi:putative sugar O-methyltransferase
VRELDGLGILKAYPNHGSKQFLDAVAEINLLHQYCGLRDGMLIMDLGGGYGRLAEFLLPLFNVSYVVVEGVALSLLAAPQYIAKTLGIEANEYWGKRDQGFRQHAFSVWPSWKIMDVIRDADILVNIHSFQEMGDAKTAFFLDLFDRFKKPEAYVFLKNNYKLVTTHWAFPDRWQVVYENPSWPCSEVRVHGRWDNTPRTWAKIFR